MRKPSFFPSLGRTSPPTIPRLFPKALTLHKQTKSLSEISHMVPLISPWEFSFFRWVWLEVTLYSPERSSDAIAWVTCSCPNCHSQCQLIFDGVKAWGHMATEMMLDVDRGCRGICFMITETWLPFSISVIFFVLKLEIRSTLSLYTTDLILKNYFCQYSVYCKSQLYPTE